MIMLDREECSHLMNILTDYITRTSEPLDSTIFAHNGKEIFTKDILEKIAYGSLNSVNIKPNDGQGT